MIKIGEKYWRSMVRDFARIAAFDAITAFARTIGSASLSEDDDVVGDAMREMDVPEGFGLEDIGAK